MNHILLHLLMLALRESHFGRSIRDIHWLDPILSIRFRDRETRCIVAILSTPGPFCYVAIENPLSGCDAKSVFEGINGGSLTDVVMPDADRVLRLSISSQRGPFELTLHLFGNAGSAILTREDTRIASLGRGGDRRGANSRRMNVHSPLVDIGESDLSRCLESKPFTATQVPGLEPELIDAFTLPSNRYDVESLLRFRDGLLKGSQSFYLAGRKGIHRAFPVPDPPAGKADTLVMGPFSNGTAAGRYIGEQLLETTYAVILEKRLRPIHKRLKAKNNLRSRLITDLQHAKQFPQIRREAEVLAAYQTSVPPGSSSIQLPNPYKEGEMLPIELDPSMPLKTQIKKRFQRASKLERSVNKITSRLEKIEKEIQHLDGIIESAKSAHSFSDAIQFLDRNLLELGLSSSRGRSQGNKENEKTYRRYDIDKNWFVLVGRNNKENDIITFHVASPNDWWFHAQSVPGSHVVLKSHGAGENPPESVLLIAASIAAFYSKSRHASLVPVIYTRRKYVRKPRKALPGKVICEREKTVFAEPTLPTLNPNGQ
jgi:predicted ribosome quality control (RQC) complex YloA/Tae2 family protein